MKVILDFPNLREGDSLPAHMDAMIEMAKEAKGFLFFIDRGDTSGIQMYKLNNVILAMMIDHLERDNPGIGQARMMAEMSKRLRGGD